MTPREDPWPVRPPAQPGPAGGDDSPEAAIEAVVDDPDEETLADPVAPEDEPTTLRPSAAALALWDAATINAGRAPAPKRRRIGKYELQTRLARGAFGVVYTARDPSLERTVAIKVLRTAHLANQEIVLRFLQEARATARIAHPGIVTIHDCGMVETRRGSTAFIAMELLSGQSLTSRLARTGPLAPAAACELARQVASALEAAHHVDVLHRDLKPDNIFLVPDPAMPSGERVKVLDFGLAKLGAGGHTQLQTVFGTPRYMSPEQGRSATQIDHRSDIYSLGCILFELVTGRTPFDGDLRQLLERHQRATPPRASTLVPDLPCALDELIADMLAKDPLDRPHTMGAVQRVLRFAAEGPAADDPPSITARSDPPAPLVMPLPPGTPSPLPGASIAHPRPPSSPPGASAASPQPQAVHARAPSSPPVAPAGPASLSVAPCRPSSPPDAQVRLPSSPPDARVRPASSPPDAQVRLPSSPPDARLRPPSSSLPDAQVRPPSSSLPDAQVWPPPSSPGPQVRPPSSLPSASLRPASSPGASSRRWSLGSCLRPSPGGAGRSPSLPDAQARPPSSPPGPQVRPPSSLPGASLRPASSPGAAFRRSPSATIMPGVDAEPGRSAVSLDAPHPMSRTPAAEAVSGEVVVPAAAIEAAAAPTAEREPTVRQTALFAVCVVAIAVAAAIALAIV